ncbi:MAG: glycoside hydrolase family 127 protein [Lachnospiraceae bacterium]|nr:glycoside hydrolase family 127 protein [Lachnospiraceae bacterium]
MHTNTSIPWILGAARLYQVRRKESWLDIVKAFWDCAVEKRGYFCTGSANAGEFWIPPGHFSEYATDRTQEFCTVYNMVRLADFLFCFTGDTAYAEYIERCLYNGFLAQQDKKSGMPSYFLPMSSGGKKIWGSRTRDFWCCHGSMIQAQTMVNRFIFYKDEDSLTVAQYIPGRAELKINGTPVVIELKSDMKFEGSGTLYKESDGTEHSRWAFSLTLRTGRPQRFMLKLRIPSWVKGMPVVSVGGERRYITEDVLKDGYLKIDREWDEQVIKIYFPVELSAESLPDKPEKKAVMEGPIALAALSEDVLLYDEPKKILYKKSEHSYEDWPWLQSHYVLSNGGRNIEFIPLYEVDDREYTLYCNTR